MQRRLSIVFLCLAALTFSSIANVRAQDTSKPVITSPKDGDTLFGLVTIQGTASNPNMQRYSLEFDLQDIEGDNFFPIAGSITQQVNAGILGQWNTTTVPDGRYQIRLSMVLR